MGLGSVGLSIEPFDARDAEMTARLWRPTRSAGLSLADRACLALALRLEAPVLTTDRAWVGLDHGVDVQVIR
jgi:PIN domain nuclease of toxin-antitoxin system